jgi:hypothetical protein
MNPARSRPGRAEGRRSPATLEILMFITALGGIAMALSAALALGGLGLLSVFDGDELTALTGLWTMGGSLAIAVALTPAAYWSGRAVFGYPPAARSRPSGWWLLPIVGYPACLLLGWLAHTRGAATLFLGPLALVGTACLSVIFVGWWVRRLGPPITPLRAWGHFTIGVTAMPLTAMVFEFIALLPLLLIVAAWLLTSSQGQAWMTTLQQGAIDPDLAMQDAGAFLQSPFVLIGLYGYVALAIPVIEELIKTMAVWPFLRRGLTATEAFLGGALGGAGYALFEALFLTQPGEGWVGTTLARIGATSLHVFTAGLTSYGLIQAVGRKRYAVAVGTFLAATAMHALWNLAAVTIGIGSVPIAASTPPPLADFSGAAALLLIVLSVVSILGLTLIWERLARQESQRS